MCVICIGETVFVIRSVLDITALCFDYACGRCADVFLSEICISCFYSLTDVSL